MQLTSEQGDQLRQAKERGVHRIFVQFTPEQRKAWREALEKELAGRYENIAHHRKVIAAAAQPSFSGDIRRAILLSRRSEGELAGAIGVEPRLLSDYRAGDAELHAAALDRLVETLGLRLVQEIPR
jgi:hypothetical protein